MYRKISLLTAAIALALGVAFTGLGGPVGGSGRADAAPAVNNAGVGPFCLVVGRYLIPENFFDQAGPVSEGACVSFVQTYLLNHTVGSSAIAASLCQTIVGAPYQGECVTEFNYYLKGV